MNAYVINDEQIKQYILIAVASLIVAFFMGYFVGLPNDIEQNEMAPLVHKELNGQADKEKEVIKENKTEINSAKSNKNKEKNKYIKDVKKKVENKKQANKIKPTLTKVKVVKVKPIKPIVVKSKPKIIKSTKASIKPGVSKPTVNPVTKKAIKNQVSKSILASANKFYSIQAGMFASKTNAQSFIEKIALKKYDAYISDFLSSSGTVKYNVRIGRFEQRDKARKLLKDFQKSFSTPAYVVITQ